MKDSKMVLIYWLSFVLANVAFIPSLEAKIDDCFEVEGVLVPALTPFDADDALALGVIPQYAQYLKDKGANGVIVAATTGEGPNLNVSENKKLLDAWMEAAPPLNLLVVAGVGGVPLPDTIEMSRYADEKGVDAIFAKPEVYFKPETPEQLVYYLDLIAKAAPNTGLVYDDFPQYTDVVVDIVEVFELARQSISTFRGVKSDVFSNLLKLRPLITGELKLYGANYRYLESEVTIGIKNFVSAEFNFLAKLVINTIYNGEKGNLVRSRNQYQRMITLIEAITEEGNTINRIDRVAAYKAAMLYITGIDVGESRSYPLSTIKKQNLAFRLTELKVKINQD